MANGLTIEDVRQIQADAEKATARTFRDAAEDNGWEPTPTPGAADAEATATQPSDTAHVNGVVTGVQTPTVQQPQVEDAQAQGDSSNADQEDSSDQSINDLRARAKELGLSGAGSKDDLSARIAEAEAKKDEEGNK